MLNGETACPMPPGFYLMDCMEAMKRFPDRFFDLAICDPPYGIGADSFNNGSGASKDKAVYGTAQRLRKNRLNSGGGALKNRCLNQSDCSWDTSPPGPEYFAELMRVSQNQIIWGGNYFDLPPTRGIIIWDKVQPWENFSQVEMAWTSFDTPAALFKMNNCMGGKIHPTQKPVALYSWILSRYAKPGYRILDTHVGSASSLIACHRAGLDFWGFEIDPIYFAEAQKRLEKEQAQVNVMEILREQEQVEQMQLWTDTEDGR